MQARIENYNGRNKEEKTVKKNVREKLGGMGASLEVHTGRRMYMFQSKCFGDTYIQINLSLLE